MNNFFQLVAVKASANLRTEVSRYYLNYLWWAIQPVLTMLTFYIVFGIFLNRGTPNYVAFLLVGLVPWQWFASCVNQASGSIIGGKGLMLQIDINKVFFPLEVILRSTFKNFFVMTLLLVFLIFYLKAVHITWIAMPVLMAVQMLYILGIGILCSCVVPFIPDLQFVITTILQLAMYASGLFYDIDKVVLPEHRFIMYLNPMAGLLKNYREILIYGRWPDWHYLGYLTIGGIIIIICSLWIINKLDHIFPRVCLK